MPGKREGRRCASEHAYRGDGRNRAVVTGAAGFIGSHLTEALLAAGRDVLGIDAFTPYYARESSGPT